MIVATLGDVKNSTIPARLNLCSDDPKLIMEVNRAIQFLLLHGSWYGTTQRACFQVQDSCVVTPPVVATIEAIRACDMTVPIHPGHYNFLPNFNPFDEDCATISFESYDLQPVYAQPNGLKVRVYCTSVTDAGKTITFQGYDTLDVPVRTTNGGVWQDGETLTLAVPFVESTTTFKSITAVNKDLTNERLTVWGIDSGGDMDTGIAIYEYWETRPRYQRYRVHGLTCNTCLQTIEAVCKLQYQPVAKDGDILLIQNLMALEFAMEGLKAKDDGDLAKADSLIFGSANNRRLGAIPMLQQELRTYTSDRVAVRVNVHGTAGMSNVMGSFI